MSVLTIPCADCEETRRRLEMTGYRVLSCNPKAGKAGMCLITFERDTAGSDTKSTTTRKRKATPTSTRVKKLGADKNVRKKNARKP